MISFIDTILGIGC